MISDRTKRIVSETNPSDIMKLIEDKVPLGLEGLATMLAIKGIISDGPVADTLEKFYAPRRKA